MKIIDVDVYMQRVLIFNNYQTLKSYCEQNNVVLEDENATIFEDSNALAGVLDYREPITSDEGEIEADFFIALSTNRYDDLSHECFHCAFLILQNAGVECTFENQEPLAYLMQFLFREYCKAFNWKYQL